MIACWRWRVWTLVATTMVLAAFDVTAAAPLPSFADVKSGYGTSEALLLDRHGAPLSEVRIDPRVRQLDWIRLADVSPAVAATLIAS
jgi:penicillin-binding protein 1C